MKKLEPKKGPNWVKSKRVSKSALALGGAGVKSALNPGITVARLAWACARLTCFTASAANPPPAFKAAAVNRLGVRGALSETGAATRPAAGPPTPRPVGVAAVSVATAAGCPIELTPTITPAGITPLPSWLLFTTLPMATTSAPPAWMVAAASPTMSLRASIVWFGCEKLVQAPPMQRLKVPLLLEVELPSKNSWRWSCTPLLVRVPLPLRVRLPAAVIELSALVMVVALMVRLRPALIEAAAPPSMSGPAMAGLIACKKKARRVRYTANRRHR